MGGGVRLVAGLVITGVVVTGSKLVERSFRTGNAFGGDGNGGGNGMWLIVVCLPVLFF